MSRFDYRQLSPKKRRHFLDQLATTIAHIRKEDEARYFLERLLTESEVVMLYRRFQIAEMLVNGLTYDQIKRKLGVGMSTVQSVDGWLTDAAFEYRQIRQYQKDIARQARYKRKHPARTIPQQESTMPGTLQHLIRHDPRFILFRLLLNDF